MKPSLSASGVLATQLPFTSSNKQNNSDVWVTVQSSNVIFDIYKSRSNYYTYLLTCDGFSSNPIVSKTQIPGISGDKERGGLAFSPDGSKFVQGHPDFWPHSEKEITIYDFDNLNLISEARHFLH